MPTLTTNTKYQPTIDWSLYRGVSEDRGTPKSLILIGFSIIFTIHFGVLLFLETSIDMIYYLKLTASLSLKDGGISGNDPASFWVKRPSVRGELAPSFRKGFCGCNPVLSTQFPFNFQVWLVKGGISSNNTWDVLPAIIYWHPTLTLHFTTILGSGSPDLSFPLLLGWVFASHDDLLSIDARYPNNHE